MWLYVPNTGCPSVPGLGCSTSDSPPQFPDTAPPVTWSGKPTRWNALWRGCRRAGFTRLLYGLTLPPSTAARGVDLWRESLAESPANRFRWPETRAEQRTSDGSGRTCSASSGSANPSGSSSRTSPASSAELRTVAILRDGRWTTEQRSLFGPAGWSLFSGRWPRQGSMRNGVVSERRMSEPRTVGSASSSWPTPDTGMTRGNRTEYCKRTGYGKTLESVAAQLWGTPTSRDYKDRACRDADVPTNGLLARQVCRTSLPESQWGTPTARDADKWHNRAPGHSRQVNLSGQASHYSLLDPETSTAGSPSSPSGPTSRRLRLNPRFVAWLMGLPPDWLEVARIDCEPQETGSSQPAPPSLLECSTND